MRMTKWGYINRKSQTQCCLRRWHSFRACVGGKNWLHSKKLNGVALATRTFSTHRRMKWKIEEKIEIGSLPSSKYSRHISSLGLIFPVLRRLQSFCHTTAARAEMENQIEQCARVNGLCSIGMAQFWIKKREEEDLWFSFRNDTQIHQHTIS